MNFNFRTTTVGVILLFSLSFINVQSQVITGTVPKWVKPVAPDYTAVPKEGTAGGYYHLLIDNQEQISSQTDFTHLAIAILTNDGIQYMSDISLDFDPSYQKLILHSIKLHRNGEIIDKLDIGKIKTIQREQSMDRFLYDGSLSAVINLDDVRVGDVLEYAYSRIGYNPVMNGYYSAKNYFDYSIPYEKFQFRLLTPKEKPLTFRYANGEVSVHTERTSDENIYTWVTTKNDALLNDNQVPSWYDPYRHLLLSDFNSWEEVVNWALPYYSPSSKEIQKVTNLANNLFTQSDPEAFMIDAIRFVQDDIRYLGFESGLNSHKPHDPSKVLEQRFGDCKDKSYLLSVLLNAKGIEATPLLVNSKNRDHLNPSFISPYAFNHCVVQIKHNGTFFYVDPTISNQGGSLENYFFPDYGKGLLIKEGVADLIDLGEAGFLKTEITETISFSEIGGNATLKVVTDFYGGDADSQRDYFSGSSIESIQKSYLNYYSNLYPDIKSSKSIAFEDKRDINQFTVFEEYEIENFWKENPEKENQIYAEVYPLGIENYADLNNKSLNRSAPYYLQFPVSYHHKTIVEFPEEWGVPDDSKEIQNDHYAYNYRVIYANRKARIEHSYETFQDHIPAEMISTLVKDHDEMMNNLSYYLTFNKGLTNTGGSGISNSIVSILMLLISLGLAVFLALRIHSRFDPPATLEDPRYSEKIGGWLILIAIGLVLSPIRVLYDFATTSEFFNDTVWTTIWDEGYWILLGVTLAEFVYNVFLIVFLILLISLFFNRRTSLPKVISIYYAATLLFTILDYVFVYYLIETPVTEGSQEALISILRSVLFAVIWIPYFNLSNRVKETFTVRYAD